ncbi:F-box protein At5g03100-like [Panicum hallii]|uniref:F-box protein At5g03100-like n=1 Tax=Panicum hallii TaxID=206008 RepID=UPI000DF4DA78|nr:F-box protein At5g03100-like [Panicum hallii]
MGKTGLDWTGLIPTKRLPSPGGGLLLLGRAYQQMGRLRLRAEEGEGQSVDRISDLPDTILGDIVSRLPAKDGARTQVLSSRWRRIWRSAPLNLDLRSQPVPLGKVHRILSSHPGPGRCFSTPARYYNELHSHSRSRSAAILDGWLRSRALNNLQELDFRLDIPFRDRRNPPPLPASALRFSCTLRIARFWSCRFPDGISIRLPVLEELQLSHAIISDSESSLHALLAGCPALQRLLLTYNDGCSRVRIASPTLRSIDVGRGVGDLRLQQLIIEDAPCLERFHHHKAMSHHKMDICVMSAPKLGILGHIYDHYPRLEIGPTVFQTLSEGSENVWGNNHNHINIRLKKIVLRNYGANESHVNFVKFFVLNARVIESIRLVLRFRNASNGWIEGRATVGLKNSSGRSRVTKGFLPHH